MLKSFSPVLLFGLFALLLAFCKSATQQQTETGAINPKPLMPNERPLAPPDDYADAWRKIDSLEREGLFQSALTETETLLARARQAKNEPQVVKALLYKSKFITQLNEQGIVKAVALFEEELKTATPASSAVLHSLLGELYSAYLGYEGYRIQNRTPIPDGEGGDIMTWSAAQIESRSMEHYLASISEPENLRKIPVDRFRAITTEGQNDTVGAPLRPVLFDLLAHRALKHFADERHYITEPVYAFVLDDPEAFAPARAFVSHTFTSQDSSSRKWRAMQAWQSVLRVHMQDANPAPLIDADLKRLAFVHNTYVGADRDSLYRKALENLHRQNADHPSDPEIVAAIARQLQVQDAKTAPNKEKEALALLKDAVKRHPGTYGAQQCAVMIDAIERPSLNIRLEKVNLPDKPAPALLTFKNLGAATVSVFRTNQKEDDIYRQDNDESVLNWAKTQKPVQQRRWTLPDPGDYLTHTTEVMLEPLPAGLYTVIVYSGADLDEKEEVSIAVVQYSSLFPVFFSEKEKSTVAVTDRASGKPVQGVSIDIFRQDWDQNLQKHTTILVSTVKTDANGLSSQKIDQRGGGLMTRFRLGNDTLWQGGFYNYWYGNENRKDRYEAHFFTDRALYRPGQTVYFKAVLIRRDKDGLPHIVPNRGTKATFYDANRQPVHSLELRSNEYGTVNGAFTAPSGGLTGTMSIQLDEFGGQAAFNVEEYKRPKFEVTFKSSDEAIRLGDKITLSGAAKSYAGSNVDGATVRYRVVRQTRFPYWRRHWGYPPYGGAEMEIANGVTETAADGSFSVAFEAVPDRSVPAAQKPVFTYTVTADVTDINGETRTGTSSVTVGYVALNASLDLPDGLPLDSLKNVNIIAKNWAGQDQNAAGAVSWQKLDEPAVFYKNRLWEQPELKTLDEKTFKNAFPDYAWTDEDSPEGWQNEGAPAQTPFNTAEKRAMDMRSLAGKPGYYKVTLKTKDAYGADVEWAKVVQVWDAKSPASRFREPNAMLETPVAEPGETARVLMGGLAPQLYWFYAPEREGRLEKPAWHTASGYLELPVPIGQEDRGGVPLFGFTVYQNRFYPFKNLQVQVPWSNKELQITYETFRDKLKPDENEVWRLKISGPAREKIAAEMVAAMYDASLDQFLPHNWQLVNYPLHYRSVNPQAQESVSEGFTIYRNRAEIFVPRRAYQQLNWFDFPLYAGRRHMYLMDMESSAMLRAAPSAAAPPGDMAARKNKMAADEVSGEEMQFASAVDIAFESTGGGNLPKKETAAEGQVRTNLQETVFFFPNLKTDAQGNVVVAFTMNEALTRWKFLAFAHTKELQQALSSKEIVTQKELMILANPPRFLRQGDRLEFAAKLSNLSTQPLGGSARLELFDALSMEPVGAAFGLKTEQAPFNVAAGQSAPLSWSVQIPEDYAGAVTWRVTAQSGAFTDGEESTIPVVSNRQLVTETLPIALRGGQKSVFTFESLKGNNSTTLRHQRYTIEFSSNPVWYAVQALPYIMEYPHECSEQIFSRFYANTLATSVTAKLPQLRWMYDRWKNEPGQPNLQSNLSKNQELKAALLEETPWVLDAQSEARQKQNIALLFDLNRMADEQATALRTLRDRQAPEGGWSWFPGGPPNWYITQHIVAGFGHLEHLGAWDARQDQQSLKMLQNARVFCDREVAREYHELEKRVKEGKAKWEDDHLHGLIIQYLYARSFSNPKSDNNMVDYYLDQGARYWLQKGLYEQGLLALALDRAGRAADAQRIVRSLRERAIVSRELGMYWPFDRGFYWYQMPVETQALLIEVFHEVAADAKAVEEMRIWLLKNKQTNRWESTKATSEAVYALLLGTGTPSSWLGNTQPVSVSIGGKKLKPEAYEAGTGYFKETWSGSEIKNNWSTIEVDNPNANIVWGAAYWQYFEDMDKIKDFRQTPLTLVKQLYREENAAAGPVLKPVTDGQGIRPGDKLKVRIEIRVDRAMEFVHLKDSRAAGLEPINVLSGYRHQGGLGYYESTRDLATHFFIDYLPKGTFVLEYPLVAALKGDFSNGMANLQCMYAPEFSSHSKGMRVRVQ